MSKEGRQKALETTLAGLNKRYGEGVVMKLGEASRLNVDAIATGSLSLDIALGVGGVPRGRIVEIYGPESSGKTTLCLHVIAQAQKQGGICGFVDVEHALDPAYAAKIGVDVENLYVRVLAVAVGAFAHEIVARRRRRRIVIQRPLVTPHVAREQDSQRSPSLEGRRGAVAPRGQGRDPRSLPIPLT